jgi:CBS domain-containing protein
MVEKSERKVSDILARTRSGAIAVAPTDTVLSALTVMAERNIGAVLVVSGERLMGILSERDCVRKLDVKGRNARDTTVSDIMTKDVMTVTSDRLVEDCRKIMSERKVRHLPVVDDGKISGVLSIRDVLEEVIAEEERQIQSLETERLAINEGQY